MTAAIPPWPRPGFRPTGRRAVVLLLAFAAKDVLDLGGGLRLEGVVPPTAPAAALDVRVHRYPDSPVWFDGWRTGAFRTIAVQQLGNVDRLDQASCCYSMRIEVDDPPDLAHLQLAWAVATRLAQAGASLTLDSAAARWHPQAAVASLSPHRPFTIQHEISVIAETDPVAGFGHPVHTRGMIKFGCPDLIAGVSADRIRETGQLLNHLARMLAEGHLLIPNQRLRVNHGRTILITPYTPDTSTPDVVLANDGLLLVDA